MTAHAAVRSLPGIRAPPPAQAARPRADAAREFMWVSDRLNQCRAQVRQREAPPVGINWSGDCPNGVAEGAGTLILLFPDLTSTTCEVTLRAGRAHGRGACVFPDGHRQESNYIAGHPVGPGALIFPDGARYEGMLRQGVPHGRGTLVRSGSKPQTFAGMWEQGCLYDAASEQFIAVLREADKCS